MSTEDTTAQLREQIAAAINIPAVKADHEWSLGMADRVMPIVLAQVEAAKATATRDALEQAADDWDGFHDLWSGIQIAAELRARASAQGVAPPAEVCTDPDHRGCFVASGGLVLHSWSDVQRSAGQGAQSSGHEYRDLAGDGQECIVRAEPKELCGKFRDDPIHQRAGQPGEQPAEPKNQWCAAPGHAGCTVNGAGVLHHHRPEERP